MEYLIDNFGILHHLLEPVSNQGVVLQIDILLPLRALPLFDSVLPFGIFLVQNSNVFVSKDLKKLNRNKYLIIKKDENRNLIFKLFKLFKLFELFKRDENRNINIIKRV
jgi:hypothetical protein